MFKMVRRHTLQNRWEYRKKDDASSSDDEPNSTSSAEPVFKKHKQISDLMSNESIKESSISNSYLLERKRARHGNNMQIMKRQKTRSGIHRRMKRRSLHIDKVQDERGSYEPATMNSNLLYMQSMLEELRVARENMIEWMRQEVRKLMADSVPDLVSEEEGSEWKNIKLKHRTGTVVSMLNMHTPFLST